MRVKSDICPEVLDTMQWLLLLRGQELLISLKAEA